VTSSYRPDRKLGRKDINEVQYSRYFGNSRGM